MKLLGMGFDLWCLDVLVKAVVGVGYGDRHLYSVPLLRLNGVAVYTMLLVFPLCEPPISTLNCFHTLYTYIVSSLCVCYIHYLCIPCIVSAGKS